MKYENRKNGSIGTIVEENEKSKTVILELEDGKTVSISTSTLKRWWKKLPEEEVYTEEVQELAQECPEISQEELQEINEASEMFAGDGTPLEEVGKEIAEQAKEKSEEVKKERRRVNKKPKVDISLTYNSVKDILKEAGYYVKQYDREPKIIPISMEPDAKKSFCNVYLGAKKCVLCMKLSEVPDGYTPNRTRNCPMGAAFDIEYGSLETIVKILNARKTIKKEEK